MTAKSSESDCQPVSVSASARDDATWTHLIQSSVPGLGFLFEVTGKPWTAWVGVLGLVFAATLAGLLGFGGGMHNRLQNENYCKYLLRYTHSVTMSPLLFQHFVRGATVNVLNTEWMRLSTVCQYNDADYCACGVL